MLHKQAKCLEVVRHDQALLVLTGEGELYDQDRSSEKCTLLKKQVADVGSTDTTLFMTTGKHLIGQESATYGVEPTLT